ncbi:MAG: lysophospholipid acyltransferase family protein [Gemmatimonadaceae bacterium]
MRTALALLAFLVMTPLIGGSVIVASMLGVPQGDGSIYERGANLWVRVMLRAAGIRVRVHGAEHIARGQPRIYMSNHMSWFDVFALAAFIGRFRFVAKSELARIPVFGPAAAKCAAIYIERGNRKSAFATYESAVALIKQGFGVCVYPEGTRGRTYPLRPFKKGPFVFAIAAQVPIVPVIVHGTMAIQPKGRLWVHAGDVDLHFLEPIPTAGLSYDERDALMRRVWRSMADALERHYGIVSTGSTIAAERVA